MKQTWEEARSALVKAGEEMKKYADRRVGEMPNYRVGDKAFIFTDNLNTTRPSRKLEQKKIGPYEVVGIPTKNAITLKLPKTFHIHPTISTHRTEKANQPTVPGQQVPPPPPVRVRGEEEFEVEEVLDSRLRRGQLEYLIRWKGYTPEHDSWEPERNLENTPEQIAAFRSRHSGAPRRVSRALFEQLAWKPKYVFTSPTYTTKMKIYELSMEPEETQGNPTGNHNDGHNDDAITSTNRKSVPCGEEGEVSGHNEEIENTVSNGVDES
ncbi:hypothetical protein CCMSSC00406_0008297 [Pleurotus cornucopiae]|uniref:Uncharacterized protein n=1 Tax=Pleurotus cornucopiae TaxID=5321 RepID=A0ACB7ITA9_PLECO|nr:hypothetical protein CCMSSC00406_0008297 [Pleurotus cornucopiae]